MGGYLSKWRQKPSTVEALEKLVKDIDSLERCRQTNLEQQKHIITSLILYSVAIYVLFFIIFYFWYWPEEWLYRILYSLPLLLFPFLVWMVKQFLHWYFVKRIRRNEEALEELKERRKTILDEVMERETYKKAKEILEKFSPEIKSEVILPNAAMATPTAGELRHRFVGQGVKGVSQTSTGTAPESLTPLPPRPAGPLSPISSEVASSTKSEKLPPHRPMPPYRQFIPGTPLPSGSHMGGPPPPGPPMARPVLPRERTLMDRMVEYLLGDGPQNRYALICSECNSHNGMAIKEEFEYLSFRCCYCYAVNQARRQKPKAPPLEPERLQPSQQPSSSSASDAAKTENLADEDTKGESETSKASDVNGETGLHDQEQMET